MVLKKLKNLVKSNDKKKSKVDDKVKIPPERRSGYRNNRSRNARPNTNNKPSGIKDDIGIPSEEDINKIPNPTNRTNNRNPNNQRDNRSINRNNRNNRRPPTNPRRNDNPLKHNDLRNRSNNNERNDSMERKLDRILDIVENLDRRISRLESNNERRAPRR